MADAGNKRLTQQASNVIPCCIRNAIRSKKAAAIANRFKCEIGRSAAVAFACGGAEVGHPLQPALVRHLTRDPHRL
jgi:protein-tyrosine-phosphatase